VALALVLFGAAGGANRARAQQGGLAAEEQNIIRVTKAATPAVVGITTPRGAGTGVIIRADGIVVTNAHVVETFPTVQVELATGNTVVGKVLGSDPISDIAVIDIPGTSLPVAPLGDSDKLQVGQTAIAIGNPVGLERTVPVGIVSAVGRSLPSDPREQYVHDEVIQTDAAINPGNSGGPLLDSSGRVIGINVAALRGGGGEVVEGLNFAVPINLARNVADQLLTTGVIRRTFLGINSVTLDPEMVRQFNLPVREGVIVAGVGRGTPAAAAGLRPEDIITRIDNTPIASDGDLRRFLREHHPGDVVTIQGVRPGGPFTVRATLEQTTSQ
jgi:S1-C subfamily serine protease